MKLLGALNHEYMQIFEVILHLFMLLDPFKIK